MPRQLTLQTKDINKPKRIPFITTFNPSLPHISHIIKKHFNLLLSSHRCKSVFQHPPVVAFRRSPNLRDLLVTAKLPFNSTHPQLSSGSFRCGKNCATCPYICHGLTTYTFFSTGETRPIKSNLTCETKNLIYMIHCHRCNLQYIGETKRRLKDRFNEHRRTIDNPNNKSKPTTAAEHFLSSPNHTANDMLLIPIEKNLLQPRLHPKGQGSLFNSKRQNYWSSWSQHPRRNLLILLPLSYYFIIFSPYTYL